MSIRFNRINAIAQAKLIVCLFDGATVPEMAEESGLRADTVRRYVCRLRHEEICYVSRWTIDRRGALNQAVYKLGRGKDAVRAPKKRTQVVNECRARKRQAVLLGIAAT